MLDSVDEQNIDSEEQVKRMPFTKGSEYIDDDERVVEAERKMEESINSFNPIPQTALPALKFQLFSFFLSNPNAHISEIEQEIEKMKVLVQKEKAAKKIRDVLPTIGIELEVPKASVSHNLSDLCSRIDLKSGIDILKIYEFRPGYSHSASVQARMLHDLENLIKFQELSCPPNLAAYAPLHVNLGVPEELNDCEKQKIEQECDLFTKFVSSAFVSKERIQGEEWADSHRLEPLSKVQKSSRNQKFRLEIRTPSFEEKSDYRMLFEVQILGAAMFSSLKESEGVPVGKIGILLSTLWKELKADFQKLKEEYNVDESIRFIADIKKFGTGFESEARSLFDRYAREASQIINED